MTDDDVTVPVVVPLLEPREGLPEVVTTPDALARAAERLAAGDGPIAVDAERASGYRYGHRAYLVQLRRSGSGTVLVDPVPFTDLTPLTSAMADVEWVLHAASQDLPCLSDVGLRPGSVFDTELAGRLLGHPRVGLAAMTQSVLGFALEKGHSAADWSTRPLPDDWLRYAALDVEVLIELRDALAQQLAEQGKTDWAAQEFAAIVDAPPPAPRTDPWRRTSGLHRVRKPRQLAAVRELWLARDAVAQRRDIAPGRILPDAAIIEAAQTMPATQQELLALPVFGGRSNRRQVATWFDAIARAAALPDDALPATQATPDGPPPARSWGDKDPVAAARLAALRTAVAAIADEHNLPTENLLAPDTVRRLAWEPPTDISEDGIASVLLAHRARTWQVGLTARALAKA
ncbi:MAG: ribonuclease D, partial [Actinomycetes bacterium]